MAEGASLTVMGGPLAGTALVIDDAVDEVLVGSDPDCRLSLDLPGVSPIHARVWRDLGGITVYDTRSPRGLYVNDDRVVDQATLRDGDVLWLGPPGDPDSVMIQCRLPEESILGAPVADAGSAAGAEDYEDDPAPSAEPPAAEPPAPPARVDRVDPAPSPATLEDLVPDDPQPFEPLSFDPLPMDASPSAAPDLAEDSFALDSPLAPPKAIDNAPAPALVPVTPEPEPEPAIAAAAPAIAATAPTDGAPEEFVMDPAWDDIEPPDTPGQPAPAPPLDLDSLLAEDAEQVAIPPTEPEPAAVPARAVPPVTPPPFIRQAGGAPPLTAAPQRAVIDDTRPRPTPRPIPRREAPEGVMDWAKGNASHDDEPSASPVARSTPRSARAPERSGRGPLLPVAGAVLALAAVAGGYFAWAKSRIPRIEAVSPARATTGKVITLTGAHLGETAAETAATIGGRPARVVQAGGGSLQLEVPEIAATPGRDTLVPIVVTAGGRESLPASVAVYLAPRLKSLAPEIAMPGENIVITGSALGQGAIVRFGDAQGAVVQAANGSLTVTVPALSAAPGTEMPVVVSMGADPSNALPFVVGRVPMVTGIDPRSAAPGDLVTVRGRGFSAQAAGNVVKVGGVPALVVSATARGLEFVVPRVIGGGGTVTISVAGSQHVGQEEMSIDVLPEPAGFRFVAEPFEDVPGHEHAAVSTALGPVFVLTTAQGKSAAERAYEAQKRFNDAAQVLRSTRTAEIRARYSPAASVYLVPVDTVLLDVTAADAEGYNEDWAPGRAKGSPVTPARLATWWEAVARDLVLLLLRGEKPTHAQALAPEGKVLADVHDASRRSVAVGVPTAVVAGARGPMREALRGIALRVPSAVSGPVLDPEGSEPAPAAASIPALKLDGSWRGSETESGIRKPITMTFAGGSGTITYERALSMSVPVLAVSAQRAAVRFEVRVGAGTRFYRGQWDGKRITGKLSSDPEGRAPTGSFELDPGR